MTNRELLQAPRQMLNEVDRQRLFPVRVEGTPVPCPACKRPVNAFEAAGIDLDDYDFGNTQYQYRCLACAAGDLAAVSDEVHEVPSLAVTEAAVERVLAI